MENVCLCMIIHEYFNIIILKYLSEKYYKIFVKNIKEMSTSTTSMFSIAAAGSSQATATALQPQFNFHQITVCAASAGVILHGQMIGFPVTVYNAGANALSIYPPVGGTILGGATNIACSLASGSQQTFVSKDGVAFLSTGTLKTVVAAGATRAILPSESGTTFTCSQAAARIYTLPAVATSAGISYKFVVTAVAANTITIRAASACIIGQLHYGAGAPTAVTGLNATSSTDIVFAASQLVGSYVSLECDGTSWLIVGSASTIASGFTVA